GGRAVRGVALVGTAGVAVGQGGLLLTARDVRAGAWRYADLKIPVELRDSWDFHAACGHGTHAWVVGRPGSALLHSADRGETWERLATGQPLPLNGVFFADDRTGWAVGEFSSILGTADGGKTWTVQRRGGQRAAVLFANARPAGLPLDTVARVGGQEGYLTTSVRVTTADSASAAP